MKQLDRDVHPLAQERAQVERAQLGYHHGEVSAELGRRWNFPTEVCDALRGVPDPLQREPLLPVAAWVHLAAWRARAEVFRWDETQVAARLPQAVGKALGRPMDWLAASVTPGTATNDAWPLIPRLPELTEGLDAMLG
jgi:HD-like signal output (HDOD) protein